MLPFLLTFIASSLLALSFYYPSLFWVPFIAFLPIMVNGNFRNFSLFGLTFSLVAFLPIFPAIKLVCGNFAVASVVFLLLVFSFFLYQFGSVYLLNKLVKFFPLTYTFAEFTRNFFPFKGFPIFKIGHVAGNLPFFKYSLYYLPAEFWSFLILLFNWLIFKTLENWESGKKRYLVLTFSTLIVLLFLSYLSPSRNNQPYYNLKLAVINPKIPQKDKLERAHLLKPYLVKTIVDTPKNVELILLPETFLTEEDNVSQFIKTFSERNLIFGATDVRFSFQKLSLHAENTVFFSVKGELKDIYKKRILVPFGEYTPKGFSLLSTFIPYLGGLDYEAGKYAVIFDYKELKFYPLICWEIFFTPSVPKKVDIVLNLTNNAWFGELFTNYHILVAKVEALKENKIVLLVNNGSFGAVIYPNGNTILLKKKVNLVEI